MNNQSYFLLGVQRFALSQLSAYQRSPIIKGLSALPLLLILVLSLQTEQAYSANTIQIRLSYKVIRNPSPPGNLALSDAAIKNILEKMNSLQEQYFRGLRFVLAEPIQKIGSVGELDGPSYWYNVDFLNDNVLVDQPGGPSLSYDAKSVLESTAKKNKIQYKWNNRAINIYINSGTPGGKCSFPSQFLFDDTDHVIAIGSGSAAVIHLHEIGHYFALFHTHESGLGPFGGEDIKDTIKDDKDWNSKDKISQENFSRPFNQLSQEEQEKVLNVWKNVMSYHPVPDRLTEGQLDKWMSVANHSRDQVVDGRTIFVFGPGGPNNPFSIHQPGFYYDKPLPTIKLALSVASSAGGDVILVGPGRYPETLTISKPVTLRATRRGKVTIGANH